MPPTRLLVVVAHPDDETFGCGSILAHAAAQGMVTTVCCATRGEAGQPAPGSGVRREELGEVRERELRAAAAVLGVRQVDLLDYADSDMTGEPPDGALVTAPLDDVRDAVAAVIERERPDVVVTLDASDGHRDHARIRDATLAAVRTTAWSVERVYLQSIPRSLLRRWAEHERTRRPDSPYLDVDEAEFGTPDDAVTTVIDTSGQLERRRAAIACHASQTSPFAGLPADLEHDFLATDHLQRVVPPWNGGPLERELVTAPQPPSDTDTGTSA